MRMYKDGITRVTVNPTLISDLKKAGYVEVKEGAAETAPEKQAKKEGK